MTSFVVELIKLGLKRCHNVGKKFGGPSHLHSHSQGTQTTHNGINSHSYNTKGERVEREDEGTYCIVFLFYTLAYN